MGDVLGVTEGRAGPDFVAFELGDGRSLELIKRSDDPEYDAIRFQVAFEVEDIRACARRAD